MSKHSFIGEILGFTNLTFSCSVILKDQGEIPIDYQETKGNGTVLAIKAMDKRALHMV